MIRKQEIGWFASRTILYRRLHERKTQVVHWNLGVNDVIHQAAGDGLSLYG